MLPFLVYQNNAQTIRESFKRVIWLHGLLSGQFEELNRTGTIEGSKEEGTSLMLTNILKIVPLSLNPFTAKASTNIGLAANDADVLHAIQ